ncbi:MAG: ATP-binding protein [Aquificaceae bacterium]|nr:ATP-binding protein [Aquificaceae bacterium]
MRLYLSFALFLTLFFLVNIAFLDNLRRIWDVSYPIILLIINLDLLVLFVVFTIFFRKFLKTYLAGRKEPLRRKLSTSLILYIITPLIFLNVATAIILLQSTKSFVSGQLKEIAKKTEHLRSLILEEEEKKQAEIYRRMILNLKEKGIELQDFKGMEGFMDVKKDDACSEVFKDGVLVLCVEGYRVELKEEKGKMALVQDIEDTAKELRNMVKGRDIIGGIYVYFLVLAGFVSFLSAVWFGNLIARHISLPLERLSQRSREIAKGNFEIGIEVPQSKDEVQELALSFLTMKEELKSLYEKLNREKEILTELFNALPVGIVFVSEEGETFKNSAYEELSKKASVRESYIDLGTGRVWIYEDLESTILAERFRTWQMAVKRIAHEIKNPLTPISLNLERLLRSVERGELDLEKVSQMTRLILEELERIRKTVDQFRSLSAEVEPEFKELYLGEVLRNVAKMYEDLKVEVRGDLKVLVDERLLRDMFFNLLNNSLQWKAKNVTVEINTDRMVYKDDGVGIEEGKEEVIFLPYHSENPEGMGLGLAIVKHIAELHRWKVRAIPQKDGFHLVFELRGRKGKI